MTMFSSKTLDRRNKDPRAFSRFPDGEGGYRSESNQRGYLYHSPRPEFQYGKLEANPTLVEFRELFDLLVMRGTNLPPLIRTVQRELRRIDSESWRVDTSPDERAFASRVLTLWLAVFA